MRNTFASPLALALSFGAVSCGHSTPLANVGVAAISPPTPLPTSALTPLKDSTPPGITAYPLLGVPEGSIGPFLSRRDDVVMSAYIGVSPDGARRVVSVPLSSSGEARGEARVVAPVATDATMLVLRPSGGPKLGFVAAWTYLTDRGEALATVGIADDGHGRGDAIELARTPDDIVWVEVIPTSRGALALWAEQPHGGDANLVAAALGPDGAMRGLPARVARGVKGWQVVPTPDGVGLALVTRGSPIPPPAAATMTSRARPGLAAKPVREKRETSPDKGVNITWQRLDADAHPLGGPMGVASGVKMLGDVDAVRAGDQTLFAWTDGSQPDPQPELASIDDIGHLHGPKRAIEGGSGGMLAAIAAGPAGAVLAWEEPFRRGRASKRITLGRVDLATTKVDPSAQLPLDLQGRGTPEVIGTRDGFAVLAPARVCLTNTPCDDATVLPTFVRLDAKLAILQVEPLRIGALRDGASAGWGLACDETTTGASRRACLALAAVASAEDGSPRVLAVDLAPRATSFRPPTASTVSGGTSVTAIDTIAAGQPFTDLAASRFGEGSIVALLASANDETAKRDDVATISVQVFDGKTTTVAPPITKRALAVGGIAIATTDRAEDGAAVAWVARDGGDPQVHVSRVDRHGKLLHDAQITNARGEATDVTIGWSGSGWVVAWVDTRDGNGEVYATTLDRDGRNVGRGQRITNAPGDASDVSLLALPDAVGPDGRGAVWLAWADPRESPQDGFADIYVAPLRATDAARVGDELRVLATAAHSRSPSLGARGKDVALGWIEEAPMGADPSHARAYGAMLAWLGPTGAPAADPSLLPIDGDGFPTAITLDGAPAALHAVLARAAPDMIVLHGLDLVREPHARPTPFPLVTLDGPPSLDVALGLTGDALFFNDESADADARRVRRATVRWRR